MNQQEYRNAVEAVQFREDFQQRTVELLRNQARQTQEQEIVMKKNRTFKLAALTASLVAALVLSVSAAVLLLSPKEVADGAMDGALAAAFDSKDAVIINESVESEGYRFTLAGMVSGKGLSDYSADAQADRTYVVAAVQRLDGSPIESADTRLVMSPLVAGYRPQRVNAWTLGGGYISFVQEGVAYYLFDCKTLEIFADHEVYLAAYEGFVPGPETFAMEEDGTITFAEGMKGPRALFTLPLDAAKADPQAVEQLLESIGLPE